MERYELPDGWDWVELGELLLFVGSGVTPKGGQKIYKTSGIPFIRSQNVYPDGLRLNEIVYISEQMHNSMARTHVKPTDVLLNITGASIGRSTVVPQAFGQANVNQHVCIIRPVPEVDPWYLSQFLNSPIGQDQIMESQSGVTRQGLNYSQLRKIFFPLAPLAVQQYLVTKIESLFEQSRTARTALTHVPVLMAQFRRAVLDSATTGRLTEEWREIYHAPEHRLVSLREVAISFKYGTSSKSQKSGEVPVLRMGNIQDRKLDWNDLVFTSDKSEIEKYKLISGDVLFNRTNSPELVGKTAVYKGERPAIYAGYLIKIRCSDALLPDYLNYCLNSPAGRDWASQVKSDGVSQSNINAQKLADFEFDLPPIEEQIEIVSRVEKMFTQADIIEQAASVSLRRAAQVEQSILARAFRGGLG